MIKNMITRIQPVHKINYTHNHKPKEQPQFQKPKSKQTKDFATTLQQTKSKL